MEKALREVAKLAALDYARNLGLLFYDVVGDVYDFQKGLTIKRLRDDEWSNRIMLQDLAKTRTMHKLEENHWKELKPSDMHIYIDNCLKKLEVPRYSKDWVKTHAYAGKKYFAEIARIETAKKQYIERLCAAHKSKVISWSDYVKLTNAIDSESSVNGINRARREFEKRIAKK